MTEWEFDPGIVIPLALCAVLYLRGSRGAARRQVACFWSGWLTLVVALVSPLHPLGEALFCAHMTQHELLMLVAAPFLVLSRPLAPFLRALPLEWRRTLGAWSKRPAVRGVWRRLTDPLTVWILNAAVLWAWHAPGLFEATLESNAVHAAQHICFLFASLLFWWSLFYARGTRSYGWGVLYIFTTAVHTSILGALLTFAPVVWYPAYRTTTQAWGLTPLQDQQIGGLIMWVPAGLVYLAAGLVLFAMWLRESDAMLEGREYAQ